MATSGDDRRVMFEQRPVVDPSGPDAGLAAHMGARHGLALNLAEAASGLLQTSLRLQGVLPSVGLDADMQSLESGLAELQHRLVHYRLVLRA